MPTREWNPSAARYRCTTLFLTLLCLGASTAAQAQEIWVAPTYQQDFGGLGVASGGLWPTTPIGAVRLAFTVPDNLQSFAGAKIALIPDPPAGPSTLNVFVCAANDGDFALGACSGSFAYLFTGVASQLAEVDVSSAIAAGLAIPGTRYLTVLAYTAPTTLTDRVLGLRFSYAAALPAGVATLGANTFTGTQSAPAFVGDGSGLTNVPIPFGVATDVLCAAACINSAEIVDGAIGNADISASAQIAPAKVAGTAAILGANNFTGTQSIVGGSLGVGTATPATALDVVGNARVSGGLSIGGAGQHANLAVKGGPSFLATGTVTVSTSSSTVTGSGTSFVTQLQIGDRLQVGATSRPVTAIGSSTSLTVSSPFTDNLSGAPMTVFPSIARMDNSAGASQVLLTDQGNFQIGSVFSSTNRLVVLQPNRFSGTATDNSINRSNALVITNGPHGVDVGPMIGLAGASGAFSVMFAGVRGAKENATVDDSRGYLGLYTVDAVAAFAERARLDSAGRLGVGTTTPAQRVEVNGGLRLNTLDVQPACAVGIRGTFWVIQRGAGLDDGVEVCVKNAADVYVWRTVF